MSEDFLPISHLIFSNLKSWLREPLAKLGTELILWIFAVFD